MAPFARIAAGVVMAVGGLAAALGITWAFGPDNMILGAILGLTLPTPGVLFALLAISD